MEDTPMVLLAEKQPGNAADRTDIFVDKDEVTILDKQSNPKRLEIWVLRHDGQQFERKITAGDWENTSNASFPYDQICIGMRLGRASARFHQLPAL